jgi:hypothetical protein
MPGILELVQQSLGGDAMQALSRQIGADPQQTQSAIATALPTLLAGLAHHTAQGDNASGLANALQAHDGGILNDVAGFLQGGGAQGAGAGLLGHFLGQHQDNAAGAIAGASGLDAGQATQLLQSLAPLLMGAISQTSQQQGGLDPAGLLSTLQGEHQDVAQGQPDLLGLATSLFGQAQGGGGLLGSIEKGLGGLLGGR